MVEKELKWYDIFVVLFGTILSFADPITDILTLVEFYRADHKTWFGVGLTFVIFPCVAFSVNYYAPKESELKEVSRARRYTQVFLLRLESIFSSLGETANPYFLRETFKKLWRGERGEFHISHDALRLISVFSPRWKERSRVSREIFNVLNFKMQLIQGKFQ